MTLRLTVAAVSAEDAGRGIARIDPVALSGLGGATGALLSVCGGRTAYVRALPRRPDQRSERPGGPGAASVLQIDAATRGNAGAAIGEQVTVTLHGAAATARRVQLAVPPSLDPPAPALLRRMLTGIPLCTGDRFRFSLGERRDGELVVGLLEPQGPALLDENTTIEAVVPPRAQAASSVAADRPVARAPVQPGERLDDGPRYEDLGGLAKVVARIREVVELPLRNRGVFTHLGIAPPKGVLLVGPPGTGKTMIARAVATETRAHFITVNAPEIVDRHYGASEQQLRAVFDTARRRAPAIIFIDEIDAIAHKRDALSGEKQVERRIVAQLLTLMDGLAGRGEVMVLAATNLPDGIDPALRRPGRFDREIRIDPPDREARREILAVHTRTMPLGADVDRAALAAATHGYVGADLAALCREAAMATLRRADCLQTGGMPDLASLRVEDRDFRSALRDITPTALREVFVEIPEVRWADIAGVDGLRDTLIRAVQLPLAEPERFARLGVRPPRGVLLHGRPGTGKTLIARALATEAQAGFISVRGPELLTEWQGASERALREIFVRARMASPCIVFFDEIDAIAGRRSSGGGATVERMVAQLLTEMDGLTGPDGSAAPGIAHDGIVHDGIAQDGIAQDGRGGLVVLAATNRPELIDPALLRPGRFDLIVEMPLPDAAGREAMLGVHVRRMPLAADVDLPALARDTEGFVGADIAGLCRLAALAALARAPLDASPRIAAGDFATALREHRKGRP